MLVLTELRVSYNIIICIFNACFIKNSFRKFLRKYLQTKLLKESSQFWIFNSTRKNIHSESCGIEKSTWLKRLFTKSKIFVSSKKAYNTEYEYKTKLFLQALLIKSKKSQVASHCQENTMPSLFSFLVSQHFCEAIQLINFFPLAARGV